MQAKHAFILGCGRSGTSIFGELFEHLPMYNYYSEPYYSDVIKLDFNQPIAIKVPRESPGFPAPKGLSFPVAEFHQQWAEQVQIFWIVRHPLDTICSLKVGISKNWGHHPRPLDWQDWLKEPLVKQCAYHWHYINSFGFQQVKHLVQIKHFEDLVLNPLSFATTISEAVGLDPTQNETVLRAWASRVQNKNNKQFVEAKTSSAYSTKDHSVKVERWKENMTQEEFDLVNSIVASTALDFGYDIPSAYDFR